MVIDKKIELFWEEFSGLSQAIYKSPEDNNLIEKLDQLVSRLGDFDWEYGAHEVGLYFCISPSLNEELIDEVENIVKLAPKIPNWKTVAGKPRKFESIEQWTMLNEADKEILIETRDWRGVLFEFPDGTYDLDVKLNEIHGNEDIKHTAIDIHLTNKLGEIAYLKLIKSVNIVEGFSNEFKSRTISLNEIDRYIKLI